MAGDPQKVQSLGFTDGSARGSDDGRGLPGGPSARRRDLTSLWYTLMVRPWTTLGIVSPEDPQRAWALAQMLVETAGLPPEELKAVSVLDASAERATAITHAVTPKKVKASGQRVRFLLATDSPLSNPVAIRVLGSCDAVLLLLDQGRSRIPEARQTITLIGPERVMGAVFALE